jgi:hypothetical protein
MITTHSNIYIKEDGTIFCPGYWSFVSIIALEPERAYRATHSLGQILAIEALECHTKSTWFDSVKKNPNSLSLGDGIHTFVYEDVMEPIKPFKKYDISYYDLGWVKVCSYLKVPTP